MRSGTGLALSRDALLLATDGVRCKGLCDRDGGCSELGVESDALWLLACDGARCSMVDRMIDDFRCAITARGVVDPAWLIVFVVCTCIHSRKLERRGRSTKAF